VLQFHSRSDVGASQMTACNVNLRPIYLIANDAALYLFNRTEPSSFGHEEPKAFEVPNVNCVCEAQGDQTIVTAIPHTAAERIGQGGYQTSALKQKNASENTSLQAARDTDVRRRV
jgi:hypothetical protein